MVYGEWSQINFDTVIIGGKKKQDRQSNTPYIKCQTCQNTHEYQDLPPRHDQF